MKNIHLLDADKPSRLFYLASNLHLEQGQLISPKNYQNIYITSDDKIKMGDWYIIEFNGTKITKCTSEQELISIEGRNDCQKIILTTNPVLISNGVQAIDDEFLEWFIKNPSCEFVDWEYKSNEYIQKEIGTWGYDEGLLESEYKTYVKEYGAYKIIIPKEEPKQETLEEFALKNSKYINHSNINYSKQEAIILGAKWQQDKILELLKNNDYGNEPVFEFLEEEFKKK
jgi:hypothetical protein